MFTAGFRAVEMNSGNIRAEDGFQRLSKWTSLCEGVLIPLGVLLVAFLMMSGLMIFAR